MVSKGDHTRFAKKARCVRGTRMRRGSVNWTPAHNSCPLDWVSGAIKSADIHTQGGGLGKVMVQQQAGALAPTWM